MRYATFSIVLVLLSGCAKERIVYRPQVIQVERTVYVPIPERLTTPLPIPPPAGTTCLAARETAIARADVIKVCNADRVETGSIQGTPVE